VVFLSYPRSGNTFLRNYLEEITGIVTGSDMSLELTISTQLAGSKGEDIRDETVWITKGHHPLGIPYVVPHEANKIICVVRNPLDTIPSFFQIMATNT